MYILLRHTLNNNRCLAFVEENSPITHPDALELLRKEQICLLDFSHTFIPSSICFYSLFLLSASHSNLFGILLSFSFYSYLKYLKIPF